MRREFPAKVKAEAALRSGGHCEKCGARLQSGCYHFDHKNPDAMGGEPSLENIAVLCKGCHAVKTSKDRLVIAKSNRVRAMHFNLKERRGFPTNRDGPFKRKMDGTIERR